MTDALPENWAGRAGKGGRPLQRGWGGTTPSGPTPAMHRCPSPVGRSAAAATGPGRARELPARRRMDPGPDHLPGPHGSPPERQKSTLRCHGHESRPKLEGPLANVPESVLFLFLIFQIASSVALWNQALRRVYVLAKQRGNDHSTCHRQKEYLIRDVHCDCHDWNQSMRASVPAQLEVHRHISK